MDRISQLAKELKHHNRLYWVDHNPEITDTEYDKLVEELRSLAPLHEALTEFVEDSTFAKVTHAVPMLSLGKVFTADEITKWAMGNGTFPAKPGKDSGLVVTYKVDGCSCSLNYADGKLISGATRGRGDVGDDITANVKMVQGVPHTVPSNRKFEVRGEIYMSRKSFAEAVASFEKKLAAGKAKEEDRPKNPRNYCAGSIKQKDPQEVKERQLSFLAHGAIVTDAPNITSEYNLLAAVERMGFVTPRPIGHHLIQQLPTADIPADVAFNAAKDTVEGVIEWISKERDKLPYDTDGVVFSVNDLAIQKALGNTSHHPKGKLAFKYGRDRGETEVVAIHWNTSRNGRVVPKVEMKPIDLGGATVTFCTGHNAKNIKAMSLSAGDKILMEREVIPYLVKKTGGKGTCDLPSKCPSCGAKLEWDETETDLTCPDVACPAQAQEYLNHYVSRKVANIMGVGEEILADLLAARLIKTPADLYRLTEGDLRKIGKQDSAQKIVASIQERKEQSLATFLYGLGIRNLGDTLSEKLAEKYGTLDAVLVASEGDLLKIDKVGDTLAKAIVNGLAARKSLIADFLKVVTIKAQVKAQGPLVGKSFCLTGHVEVEYGVEVNGTFTGKKYDARPDIENLIKSKGGTIKSVSKGLSFLVAGDGSGDKLQKANKLGIKVIDGHELEKMLKV